MINNVSLDHKSMDELRVLFADFAGKARTAVLNLDNPETAALARSLRRRTRGHLQPVRPDGGPERIGPRAGARRHRLHRRRAHERRDARGCACRCRAPTTSPMRWRRSAAVRALGVPLAEAAEALGLFTGIRRRLEVVGQRRRRHRDRRLRPQPGQDRRHAGHAARLPGPAAGDVPAARLRPAEADEGRLHRGLRPRPGRGRRAADAPSRSISAARSTAPSAAGDIAVGSRGRGPQRRGPARPRRLPASGCWSWPGPATGSWSWARATTR